MPSIDKYIENKDFVAWALGDDSFNDYWKQYLDQHPEESEDIEAAKSFVQKTSVKDPYFSVQREKELWDQISAKVVPSKTTKTVSMQWWKYAVAVVVLGFIASFYFLYFVPSNHVEIAHKGYTKDVDLPDGSKVALNAESTISFNKSEFSKERLIELKGEAFFEVEKGTLFQVQSEKGNVTVLGTSFNIYSRNDKWTVECFSGKVLVEDRAGKSVTLTKGEGVAYKDGDFVSLNTKGKLPSWKQGIFTYQNETLEEVFQEVQRQFDVRIIYKNPKVQHLRFTGTITNKSLETTLEVISKTMGINYQINKDKKEVEISM
ncbi:FecR domain-containing protein [Flammeovirga yaeyamensis]|uniref:FecR domain-containing protein n=1 Tax=Flammeovirga yaeyamensis TaxID=367791 RepID=A0AAX1N2X6_9BACT|nr:FecR domain-containing protein [Flammeovirga yaeyamensis]MBB3701190.1 ferric-dicitrate binding protein FerR (iron transport regulator) [Flammeovirga yaeyamensis]NMF38484.1 FecR family protein [Flammeovirga yaeyamensis]QWG01656.1 FecR domain-containing protein [Flammeovirga yaeyamensis]